jgi:hypothetical protein
MSKLFALLLVLLSACATTTETASVATPPPPSNTTIATTGPLATGGDTYVVVRETNALPPHITQLAADVLTEATEKCSKLGRRFRLISTTESPRPYTEENHAKVTTIFACD